MGTRIGGTRPRPRVAFLGKLEPTELERYKQLFPTVWSASTVEELRVQVDFREIDLLVIARSAIWSGYFYEERGWLNCAHVICFLEDIGYLPGPVIDSWLDSSGRTETEEYLLPDIPLPLNRRRGTDLAGLTTVKGWLRIKLKWGNVRTEDFKKAKEMFDNSAIVTDPYTQLPLATIYQRVGSDLGIAWLPNPIFDQVAWVELIAMYWAQSDRERFPGFGDWTKSPDWMLPEEEELVSQISALEDERSRTIARIDQEVGVLASQLAEATLATNRGRRRLLTAQGDELVEEVTTVFGEIGFEVEQLDQSLGDNATKKEDLRLRDPAGENKNWEAIVEVRGYARSAGQTSDLMRLARFAELYQKEKGQLPDQRIYVVNGQIEWQPPQRQEPLAAARGDVDIFGEAGGVIVSTIDLYRMVKVLKQYDHTVIRESIKRARGRWTVESVRNTARRWNRG